MYQSELTDRVDEIEKLGQLWKNSGRQSSFNKFLRWALFIQRLANPIQTRGEIMPLTLLPTHLDSKSVATSVVCNMLYVHTYLL